MQNTRKVTDDIIWVGCNDRRLAMFENIFPLQNGVSYNSYLVMDEKITLFDTMDSNATEQFIENIDYVLNGKAVDYLVIQHMEPDHCSNIARLLRKFPQMKLVVNAKTVKMIEQFFHAVETDKPPRHDYPKKLIHDKAEVLMKFSAVPAVTQIPVAVRIRIQALKRRGKDGIVDGIIRNALQDLAAVSVVQGIVFSDFLRLYLDARDFYAASVFSHTGTSISSNA